MKRIITIAAALFLTVSLWAQSPEKMSYQAVVRNSSDALVTSAAVGMQISILQGGATGTAVYVETQTPTTNANGLVSLEIGAGTVVSGDFTTIDWANDTYFIKTETDPTGGTTYTITGTTQLMSVPYALHAKTAENITGTVSYTETDPVFGASIANGITATDTTNWNNHTVDTDTQLDSTDIAIMGYIAGSDINGTTNYLVKFTGVTAGGNSQIFDDGTNIGIGTSNPSENLVVSETAGSTAGTDNFLLVETVINPLLTSAQGVLIQKDDGQKRGFKLFQDGSDDGNSLFKIASFSASADVDRLTIKRDNGNVGIGTSNPTSKLQVVGLPVFADNTSAIAGGLTLGAFYRTSTGVLMVVF
jgi:hypothetical protein